MCPQDPRQVRWSEASQPCADRTRQGREAKSTPSSAVHVRSAATSSNEVRTIHGKAVLRMIERFPLLLSLVCAVLVTDSPSSDPLSLTHDHSLLDCAFSFAVLVALFVPVVAQHLPRFLLHVSYSCCRDVDGRGVFFKLQRRVARSLCGYDLRKSISVNVRWS